MGTQHVDSSWRVAAPLRIALMLATAVGLSLGPAPRPAHSMPDAVRIPKKVPHGKGDPPDAALFSHFEHNRYYCYTCHPGAFPQRRLGFTHDDMDAGRFCGGCHDGKRAFSPDDDDVECELCHRPPAWTSKWGRP